ncbi:MAG: DUF1844 domain-containing protein [Terriglobia bacterium]|jgi:hypothetical protein
MAGEESSSSGFKVVDRRPFAADGSRKEEIPAEEKEVEAAPEGDRSTLPEPQSEPGGQFEDESSGFETLVSYLSTTAMFQLGLIPGPSGEHIPADMPNAKRTVDLLEVLQEKTKGNLSASESRLLQDVLYELRMSFVEMQKRQARKSK